MNPVCVKCNKEMICHKNDVSVAFNGSKHMQYSGDVYICPSCSNKIVTSFGEVHEDRFISPDVVIGD